MSERKHRKRLKNLLKLIEDEEIPRLRNSLRKYKNKVPLSTSRVNEKGQTLLHVAGKRCRADAVRCLLREEVCNPMLTDDRGNLPIHLALKTALKTKNDRKFYLAYHDCVLLLLKAEPSVLKVANSKGIVVKELLQAAEIRLESLESKPEEENESRESPSTPEDEWRSKLAGELDDEYQTSWGQYENDYDRVHAERETYDDWASRMSSEHREKRKREAAEKIQPGKQAETEQPKWTEEDQRLFEKEEEARRADRAKKKLLSRKEAFDQKYTALESGVTSNIEVDQLPFALDEQIETLASLILYELNSADDQARFLKEKQRQWHPDKFAQKFGSRLPDDLKEAVLRKVTEISQYLNSFSLVSNK